MLPDGYSDRLVGLVEEICKARQWSVNQLAKEVGSSSLSARVSHWRHGLKTPVTHSTFDLLSKVDPKGRTAKELRMYVGGSLNYPKRVEVSDRIWDLITKGGLVHKVIRVTLEGHGYTLDAEGIQFFLGKTQYISPHETAIITEYLANKTLPMDKATTIYPTIADTLTRLLDLPSEERINWIELASLDGLTVGKLG